MWFIVATLLIEPHTQVRCGTRYLCAARNHHTDTLAAAPSHLPPRARGLRSLGADVDPAHLLLHYRTCCSTCTLPPQPLFLVACAAAPQLRSLTPPTVTPPHPTPASPPLAPSRPPGPGPAAGPGSHLHGRPRPRPHGPPAAHAGAGGGAGAVRRLAGGHDRSHTGGRVGRAGWVGCRYQPILNQTQCNRARRRGEGRGGEGRGGDGLGRRVRAGGAGR